METKGRQESIEDFLDPFLDEKTSRQLSASHELKWKKYCRLIDESQLLKEERESSSSTDSPQQEFWDIVVLTAMDERQKRFYETKLEEKRRNWEIPLFGLWLVIADPPGTRIGCGGATMQVLQTLEETLGKETVDLDSARILIIHAGGYSKRLPHHSVTGKIFAALPYNFPPPSSSSSSVLAERTMTMLEMKLTMYVDFPSKMAPGVFISSADDIEFFESSTSSLSSTVDFTSSPPGFTAITHPSSWDIGLGHGVYVLEPSSFSSTSPSSLLSLDHKVLICSRFLHKPSYESMRQDGAIISSASSSPIVFVDSAFFFDRQVAKLLANFYREHSPLNCEIDAYGDFMQPLGRQANTSYLQNTKNVTEVTPSLFPLREKLFHMLNPSFSLSTIPLIPSIFLHIGTFDEYLDHFCYQLPRFGSTRFVNVQGSPVITDEGTTTGSGVSSRCCMLHSSVTSGCNIESGTVVEFSSLHDGVKIGKGCILSQLHIPTSIRKFVVPSNTFIQTFKISTTAMGLKQEGREGLRFVAAVFGVKDNLKGRASSSSLSVPFTRGLTLGQALDRLGLKLESLWSQEVPESQTGLWNARLFPVCESEEMSLNLLLEYLRRTDDFPLSSSSSSSSSSPSKAWCSLPLISFEQCVEYALQTKVSSSLSSSPS